MYLRECLFAIAVLCGCATPAGGNLRDGVLGRGPPAPAQAPPGDEPLVGLDESDPVGNRARVLQSAAARHRVDAARSASGEHALPDRIVSGRLQQQRQSAAGRGPRHRAHGQHRRDDHAAHSLCRQARSAGAVAARDVDAEAVQIDSARLDLTARVKDVYYRLAYVASAEAVHAPTSNCSTRCSASRRAATRSDAPRSRT